LTVLFVLVFRPALVRIGLVAVESQPQFESLWTEAFVRSTDQLQRDVPGSPLVKFGTGAATVVIAAPLKIVGGSGSPVRVLAITP
jgi:hypothetical protein